MFVSKILPTEIAFPEGYENLELSHVEYEALLMLEAFQSQPLPQQNLGSYLHPQSKKWDLKNLWHVLEYLLIGATPKLSNLMDLALRVCLLHQRMTTY